MAKARKVSTRAPYAHNQFSTQSRIPSSSKRSSMDWRRRCNAIEAKSLAKKKSLQLFPASGSPMLGEDFDRILATTHSSH